MSEDIFAEKLAWFKGNESPEVVLLLSNDPERIRIVVAWISLSVERTKEPSAICGDSEDDVWEWLWENVEYSRDELIDRIGVPLSNSGLESNMRPLIANRVLYPDGTVNSFVRRYLREQVLKLFDDQSRGRIKRGRSE